MGRVKKNKPRRVRPLPTGLVLPPVGTPQAEGRHPEVMGADQLEEDDWDLEEDDWVLEEGDWVPDTELGELLRARGWVNENPDITWTWGASSGGKVLLPTTVTVADSERYIVSFALALDADQRPINLSNFADVIGAGGLGGSWREMGFGRDGLIAALDWIEAYKAGDPSPEGSGLFGSAWDPATIERLGLLKEPDPTPIQTEDHIDLTE